MRLPRSVRLFLLFALTGPRQSGKTALSRNSFPDKPCQTLEDPVAGVETEADVEAYVAKLKAECSRRICWRLYAAVKLQ